MAGNATAVDAAAAAVAVVVVVAVIIALLLLLWVLRVGITLKINFPLSWQTLITENLRKRN